MFDYKSIPTTDIALKLGLKRHTGGNFTCFNASSHKDNDKHPSLSISKERNGGFYCFGCGRRGNNVELVKQVRGLNFIDAIEWLKENFNNSGNLTGGKMSKNNTSIPGQIEKYHIRLINKGSNRFTHVDKNDLNIKEPSQSDIDNIKDILQKSFKLETLQKAGIKISHGSGEYGMIFPKGQIVHNPNKLNEFLHVEGRTDFLSAIELDLDNNYAIVSDYNKTTSIEIDYGTHCFLMDSDVDIDGLKNRIKTKEKIQVKFIRLPDNYKDLSDYYNHGKCTLNDVSRLIESEGFIEIKDTNKEIHKEATNHTTSVSLNADDLKKYVSEKKLICIGGKFFNYDDGYYKEIKEEHIKQELIDTRGKYGYEIDQIYKGLKIIAHKNPREVNPSRYLNLRNCIFDTMKLKEINHTPDIISTVRLPVNYNTNAKCLKFLSFIEGCIPNEASRKALQEFLGYCLSTNTEYQKALFLIGTGNNGKGILLRLIKSFFGQQNISFLDLADFGSVDNRAMLFGKLLNVSTEMSDKIRSNDFKIFKQVTSFEEITGHFLFKDRFVFQPKLKLIFSVNKKPTFPENNTATFRRLLFIDFPIEFSEEKGNIDYHLYDKLNLELEGIFLWLISGLKRLRENKCFSQDEYMNERMNMFKIHNDSLGMFIKDCCNFKPESKIKKSLLYDAYKTYCSFFDTQPESNNKLGKYVMGLPSVRDDRNYGGRYSGIDIITENYNTEFQNSIKSVLPVGSVIAKDSAIFNTDNTDLFGNQK